jgi:hypothetical protein
MCTYCGTKYYRKIYENHIGPIPYENNGRVYEIHHIDGNHKNNDPINLKAVTLQEHYNIHYAQGDYGACYYMMIERMDKSPAEISIIASKNAKARIKAGTHNFLGKNNPVYRQLQKGHHFEGGQIQRDNIKAGTHNFVNDNPSRRTWTCEVCGKNGVGLGNKSKHRKKCDMLRLEQTGSESI